MKNKNLGSVEMNKELYDEITHKLRSLPDFSVFDKRNFASAVARNQLSPENLEVIRMAVDLLVGCNCLDRKDIFSEGFLSPKQSENFIKDSRHLLPRYRNVA